MKKSHVFLAVLLFLAALVILSVAADSLVSTIIYSSQNSGTYREACSLMEEGKYKDAAMSFAVAGEYRDSYERRLWCIAKSREKYDSNSSAIEDGIDGIDELSKRKHKFVSDAEMTELRDVLSKNRVVAEEKERMEAEERQEEYEKRLEKEREEIAANLADPTLPVKHIPRVGMSDIGIDHSTGMGKPGKASGTEARMIYTWYSSCGDMVLIAVAKDGRVTSVTRYNEAKYWSNGTYIPTVNPDYVPKYRTGSQKNERDGEDDPYDAKKYSDADDFYEDNFLDFESYDDAESYWEEYGDD